MTAIQPRIGWACITLNRLAELRVVIRRMAGNVDAMIVIDGGSVDDTVHYLRGRGDVDYRIIPWRDHFSNQRTHYIERARQLKLDWLFVSDTDEWYSQETARNLRVLASLWHDRGFGGLELRCEEVGLLGDREHVRKRADPEHSFYKLLGFRVTTGLHYEGNPHEGLVWGGGEQLPVVRAPGRFYYEHVKPLGVIAARGARNFYIGGGGDNERVPKWEEFRREVSRAYGPNFDWPDFDRQLVRGEVASNVARWILDHRHDHERPGDSEVREMYLYYFRILHPELDPYGTEHISGQECSIP